MRLPGDLAAQHQRGPDADPALAQRRTMVALHPQADPAHVIGRFEEIIGGQQASFLSTLALGAVEIAADAVHHLLGGRQVARGQQH